uniref:Meiosis/spermiosis associated 1 n=1 Tax=Gallus gallus TaxID=9031 RepID=A0A8V0XP47_CHICK
MVSQEMPSASRCLEELHSSDELSTSSKEVLKPSNMKMSEVSAATSKADIKPKSICHAKKWSDEVENLYRFQQAGYRDEVEYKQVKQVDTVECWPETGFVKKLQRKDNTFYYYNKQRECEDKDVHKVKVYVPKKETFQWIWKELSKKHTDKFISRNDRISTHTIFFPQKKCFLSICYQML